MKGFKKNDETRIYIEPDVEITVDVSSLPGQGHKTKKPITVFRLGAD